MFANKFRAGIAVTALVASGLAISGPALADPNGWTPAAGDFAGVGSDTSEIVTNALAGSPTGTTGFNPGKSTGRIASYDATGTAQITLPDGTVINRPNGSTGGKNLLHGSTNNTHVDFARSSSALSVAEAGDGLVAYPFAADYLVTVTATTTNAPTALSIGQVLGIYNGTFTNWSQLGGANAPIHPFIPQTGSGTRNFFIAQLTAANGGVAPVLASSVQESQEHDPTKIQGDPDAIAPFSQARLTSTVRKENGWIAQRAIYNVTRGGSTVPAGLTSLFNGSGSFFCGGAAKTIIEQNGFLQLNAATCGVPNTTSGASAVQVSGISPVKPVSTISVATSPSVRQFGSAANAIVTVTSGGSGIVSINGRGFAVAGAVSGNQAVVPIPTTLAAGVYPITANYSGNADFQGSTATGTLTVTRANGAISSVKVKLTKAKKHKKAKTYTATVRVSAAGVTPTGAVVIKKGAKTVGVGSIRNGVATVTIKISKLKKGKNKLTVSYLGDGNVNPVTKNIKVKRK